MTSTPLVFYKGDTNIYSSTFDGNSGTTGSVLSILDGSAKIYSSTFSNNNGAVGGAIYSSVYNSVNIRLVSNTFQYNSAANGSCVYIVGQQTSSAFNLVDLSSTYDSNSATFNGGAVYTASAGTVNMIGTTLTRNNINVGAGGSMYLYGADISINTCYFSNNAYSGASLAIVEPASFIIQSSQFFSNHAFLNGGGIMIIRHSAIQVKRSVSYNYITDSNFTMNTATYGGGIYIANYDRNFNISVTRSRFTSNWADYGSGEKIFTYENDPTSLYIHLLRC